MTNGDPPYELDETVEVVNYLSRLGIRLACEVKEHGWHTVLETLSMIAEHTSRLQLAIGLARLAETDWPDDLHNSSPCPPEAR
jgi:hypothetical protein